jgi:hypothetical protein
MPNYAQAKEKENRSQQEEGGAASGQRVRTITYELQKARQDI